MPYHNYVLFYLFFITYLFLEIKSFTPAGRSAHSSVLVGKKIYFFGGVLDSKFCSNEVFYLDVSQPFNIQVPLWNDLIPNAGIPFKSCWGTVSLSDINNEQTIYLFGGVNEDIITNTDNFKSIIHSFKLNSLSWNIPTVNGIPPERRREMNSVIDNTGKMYIFSGGADEIVGSPTTRFFNDTVIFNTVELSWSIINSLVIARAGHTATILPNGIIVYIGGFDSSAKTINISQITLYNTKSMTWTNKVCTKKSISILATYKQLIFKFF